MIIKTVKTFRAVSSIKGLTFPMLRLLSSKEQGRKDFWKSSKPCHVGIHWIAFAENSHMSTHVPGFHFHFSGFCIDQINHQQHKG